VEERIWEARAVKYRCLLFLWTSSLWS